MYTLYYSPGAASLAVHWMLVELRVPFETVLVDLKTRAQDAPAYRRINPLGMVPTLTVDGTPRSESAALLMLLAERHPQAGFAPEPDSPDRAAYLQLMVYLANALLPAFRAWFYVAEYAAEDHVGDTLDHARARIERVCDQLDVQLSDGRHCLLGATVSAPDFLAAMLSRWSRLLPKPAASWPHLGPYAARMTRRPSFREVMVREAAPRDRLVDAPSAASTSGRTAGESRSV